MKKECLTLDVIHLNFGDDYFLIDKENFTKHKAYFGITFQKNELTNLKFKYAENAEKWIEMNKPKYSEMDVILM